MDAEKKKQPHGKAKRTAGASAPPSVPPSAVPRRQSSFCFTSTTNQEKECKAAIEAAKLLLAALELGEGAEGVQKRVLEYNSREKRRSFVTVSESSLFQSAALPLIGTTLLNDFADWKAEMFHGVFKKESSYTIRTINTSAGLKALRQEGRVEVTVAGTSSGTHTGDSRLAPVSPRELKMTSDFVYTFTFEFWNDEADDRLNTSLISTYLVWDVLSVYNGLGWPVPSGGAGTPTSGPTAVIPRQESSFMFAFPTSMSNSIRTDGCISPSSYGCIPSPVSAASISKTLSLEAAAASNVQTVPCALQRRVAEAPKRVMFRHRESGEHGGPWLGSVAAKLYGEVMRVARGLLHHGCSAGDGVVLCTDPLRRDWATTFLAASFAACVTAPIPQDAPPDVFSSAVLHAAPQYLVTCPAHFFPPYNLSETVDCCPSLRAIIVLPPPRMHPEDDNEEGEDGGAEQLPECVGNRGVAVFASLHAFTKRYGADYEWFEAVQKRITSLEPVSPCLRQFTRLADDPDDTVSLLFSHGALLWSGCSLRADAAPKDSVKDLSCIPCTRAGGVLPLFAALSPPWPDICFATQEAADRTTPDLLWCGVDELQRLTPPLKAGRTAVLDPGADSLLLPAPLVGTAEVRYYTGPLAGMGVAFEDGTALEHPVATAVEMLHTEGGEAGENKEGLLCKSVSPRPGEVGRVVVCHPGMALGHHWVDSGALGRQDAPPSGSASRAFRTSGGDWVFPEALESLLMSLLREFGVVGVAVCGAGQKYPAAVAALPEGVPLPEPAAVAAKLSAHKDAAAFTSSWAAVRISPSAPLPLPRSIAAANRPVFELIYGTDFNPNGWKG